MDFIQGACSESLDNQVHWSNYSPSPPMKLMTSQSLPPSSARSDMIMSHRIDLAGQAHRKNSLTLHCFLTWNSNQGDKISPPYPPGFHTKQVSHPWIGLGLGSLLTPSKTASPMVFFQLHWLVMPVWKRGHLLAKSHRYKFTRILTKINSRTNHPLPNPTLFWMYF